MTTPPVFLSLSGRPGAEVHDAVNFAITEFCEVRLEGLSTKALGGSWPTGVFDGLAFPASGLVTRAQQVLKRLSLEGFVGNTPGTEARHHRAVRAPKRGCVRVAG
jgi:hypothetical protein